MRGEKKSEFDAVSLVLGMLGGIILALVSYWLINGSMADSMADCPK